MQEPLTSLTALSRFLSCHISSSIKIVKNASWIWGDFKLEEKNFKIAPLVPQQLLTTYLPIPIYSTAVKNASLNAFQLRSIRVPIAFHSRSVIGTHLRNAFRLHSYRNRTSSEIIAISRVYISQRRSFTFCVHTIEHQTAFLYLLSSNESRIKITYVHITYLYVLWSILLDKTKHSPLISSIRHQVPNYHVENGRAFHKTLKGIKINKNSFEGILMTLKALSTENYGNYYQKLFTRRVLNRLSNFISERGSQNITVFRFYKIIIRLKLGLHCQSFCDNRKNFKWIK
jgi:hypothetical protein